MVAKLVGVIFVLPIKLAGIIFALSMEVLVSIILTLSIEVLIGVIFAQLLKATSKDGLAKFS